MQQKFATTADISGAFAASVMVGAGVIGLVAVVVIFQLWHLQRRTFLLQVTALALAAFARLLYLSYSSSFGRFTDVEVSESGVELRYVGPLAQDLVIPHTSIDTVLFGSPGKAPRPCYVKVVEKSGQTYRSADLDFDLSTCKEVRSRMLAALGR